jgi:flavorubredoxin
LAVPREYGVTEYRYTIVNDRTVLVDPKTHRIIQIIE